MNIYEAQFRIEELCLRHPSLTITFIPEPADKRWSWTLAVGRQCVGKSFTDDELKQIQEAAFDEAVELMLRQLSIHIVDSHINNPTKKIMP